MTRVAVTGFGVVSPIGSGCQRYWDALAAGASGIGRITRFDCSTFAVQLAGEVKDDPPLPDRVREWTDHDRKIGYGFAAVREALGQSGIGSLGPGSLLHLGVSVELLDMERVAGAGRAAFDAIATHAVVTGCRLQAPLDTCTSLVANAYGRPGRAITNCSACAASAQAIGHGFREVRAGRCDVAVCGGLDSMLNPLAMGGFQLLGALTTDNDRGESACRPFDASRTGAVLGEGAAAVVLEPLDRATAGGKTILAEVCGYGSTLDAHSLAAPDPEGDGAARAMLAALADAGVTPRDIHHINAHGTGTQLNDGVEAKAIRRVFDGCWQDIPVSATKSVTGHLIAACGAAEFGACLLALHRSLLPANPWLRRVGSGCELAHVTGQAAPFSGEYVLSNSFGFGGQNAALILRRCDGR